MRMNKRPTKRPYPHLRLTFLYREARIYFRVAYFYTSMAERTTLSVNSEIRDRIRSMKVGGETYTDVLRRLISDYEPNEAQQ